MKKLGRGNFGLRVGLGTANLTLLPARVIHEKEIGTTDLEQ
jgi:hypothetical protein